MTLLRKMLCAKAALFFRSRCSTTLALLLALNMTGCGWGIGANLFTNPLLRSGADPWVTSYNGYYYYMDTNGWSLAIRKTQDMSELKNAPSKVVWVPDAGSAWSQDVWAPELHRWDGKWYIYFAADKDSNASHRIYVVENSSEDPTEGQWTFRGKVADSTDKWAIDPDLIEINGAHYLLWSGWPGDVDGEQDIYIAKMSNPWTISSPRTLVSKPTYSWETVGLKVNEGPEAMVRNGKLFVTFSASGCWTDAYKLGMAQMNATGDLLDPTKWTKRSTPMFQADSAAGVYGPGHNGFFQSPGGTQDWIIYHANSSPNQGCGNSRTPRIQPFNWKTDGTPNYGVPVSDQTLVLKP